MTDLYSVRNSFEEKCWTTLKETSKYQNNKYLCQSQEKVINFDTYTQRKARKTKTNMKKSFDVLHFNCKTSHIYCVEFKNKEMWNFFKGSRGYKGQIRRWT